MEEPTLVLVPLSELFPREDKLPTYPHRPGVPCPDCGWDGVVKDG